MARKTVVKRGTNPKDLIGATKAPLALVPPALTIITSVVMRLGAKKYGPYNWRDNAVRRTVYLEAAMRHILSALDGEDTDPESRVPHEAHAAACMGIILDALVTGNLVDDRPKPGAAAKLIGILQAIDKSNGELSFLAALAGDTPGTGRRVNGKARRVRRKQ